MPAKVDTYLDLAREIAQGLAGSVGAWTAFLDTASRLYKYPFHDQLMSGHLSLILTASALRWKKTRLAAAP